MVIHVSSGAVVLFFSPPPPSFANLYFLGIASLLLPAIHTHPPPFLSFPLVPSARGATGFMCGKLMIYGS